MDKPILDVKSLQVELPNPTGFVKVVDDVSYHLASHEVLGIAGESGSGKTMTTLAIMGLLPRGAVVDGEVWFGGRDLLRLPHRPRRTIAGREIAMVFQDPMTSLHPMLTIGRQLCEHMKHHLGVGSKAAAARGAELLDQVDIPDPDEALHRFPHEFSGGMRQRIAIAIAIACDPKVLIADEPTTALDVTVQASLLRLLDRLRQEKGLSVVLITHDLGVMSSIADRIAVFYAGRIVEEGCRRDLLQSPRHPYTKGLLAALPHPERNRRTPLAAVAGEPPSAHLDPQGCRFQPRCPHSRTSCRMTVPMLVDVGEDGHKAACPVDPFGRS